MEELKGLVKKPTTSGQLEKPKNLSDVLSTRQAALTALIQKTQARRGLPLITVGSELRTVLSAWESALKNVPDGSLSRVYERAAENWPWTERKDFLPDAVADAYKVFLVENRQREEAERRNAVRRDQETYKCFYCLDVGYQPVYQFLHGRWYSSLRPCVCDAIPITQRSVMALEEPEFTRNKSGEFIRQTDLDKHGPPYNWAKEIPCPQEN